MHSIFLDGGIGDVFALESAWTEEERRSLERIYWRGRSHPVLIPLFRQSKRYGHVKHYVVDTLNLPNGVDQWTIFHRFHEIGSRPFSRCSFLDESVEVNFSLPENYLLIQHQTPANLPTHREERDLQAGEWGRLVERLEEEDRVGVVVNTPDADRPPQHPRVIDLIGQTSLQQSIALLARAGGYWGIASSLCVLASQIFTPEQMWVKGVEDWLWMHRYIYFRPHTTFPYLYRDLRDSTPWTIDKDMKTVEFKVMRYAGGNLVMPGSVVQLSPTDADAFVKSGQARYYDPVNDLAKDLYERAPANQPLREATVRKAPRKATRNRKGDK